MLIWQCRLTLETRDKIAKYALAMFKLCLADMPNRMYADIFFRVGGGGGEEFIGLYCGLIQPFI